MSFQAWADLPAHHAASLSRGAAARLPQGRGPTCWGQKEYSGAASMGGGYLSDAAFLSGTASAGGGCIPFRPVPTPGRTARDRTSTH